MISAWNVSTIVVCLARSTEPLARNSLLCSRAFVEAARKVVAEPTELTSTNDAHRRMQSLMFFALPWSAFL